MNAIASRWRKKLEALYPPRKPLNPRDAMLLRQRLPNEKEALHSTRSYPVFAVRVPKEELEVTQMLSKLTGRKVSEIKKLIVLEGILQILTASKPHKTRTRKMKHQN